MKLSPGVSLFRTRVRSLVWAALLVGWLTAEPASCADRTPAPLPPDEAVRAMKLPSGFVATLVAAEPDLVQPISFCLDDRGRLFVAEAMNYGAWQPTGRDRIVILEDHDGDSRVDERKVFFEGLNYVTGIEYGFGGVWVMSPPGLYFIPDRDGDDQPDGEPELLFDGFGYQESRHNLANGFTWGPDGWLYAGHGRTSPSHVGKPGTPISERILCDGGVYRIHPTRHIFENFADGTTNPWGVDFDDFGQCFVSNCVNPHLFHVIQGAHYEPWRNRPSSMYAYDRIATIADHLHYPSGKPQAMRGETPETLEMGGGHAHCGTLIYLGDNFPAEYRNGAFMCNIHGRRINHDRLRRNGSGYVASHEPDLMIAADPWFMGVTLRTGPDGSVLVSDWSDTGECHTYQPETGTGRLYKISFGPPRATPVNLAERSDRELAECVLHSNDWYVRHARRLLQERSSSEGWDGSAAHEVLRAVLGNHPEVPRRLRALWALHACGGLSREELGVLLLDPSEHIVAWTIQLLCEQGPPTDEQLATFVELAVQGSSPRIRLYLAAALQRLPHAARWELAAALLGHPEDAEDPNLPLMYWYGIEPLVPENPRQALSLADEARVPKIREFLARRHVDHKLTLDEEGQLDDLVAAVAAADEPVRRDLLAGAHEALRGRKSYPLPGGWSALQPELLASDDPEIRDMATSLAVLFGDPTILSHLRQTASNALVPAPERIKALEALLRRNSSELIHDLQQWIADEVLCVPALRGLAASPHPDTPRRIMENYSRMQGEERTEAVSVLASRRDFAEKLLDAVEQGRIPHDEISAYAARQIYSLDDESLTRRLRKVWGEIRDSSAEKGKQIARWKKSLTADALKQADVRNGRRIYAKTCQQCHVLFGTGQKIGPDLTGSNRTNLDYLLGNILDPSAEIGRDYRLHVVTTVDGRVLTGMILEKTPNRLTVQTATETISLPLDAVEEIADSSVSMMPEGQLDRLTPDEVRDLIGYLASPRQVDLPEQAAAEDTPQ